MRAVAVNQLEARSEAPAADAAPEPGRSDRAARHAIFPGALGAATLVALSWVAYRTGALELGWPLWEALGGGSTRAAAALSTLLACGLLMFVAEAALCAYTFHGRYLSVDPKLRSGRWGAFLADCLAEYAANLALLLGATVFIEHAVQFDHQNPASQYTPWFALMELLVRGYLWLGLPYVLATRALQHDPAADRKDASQLVRRPLLRLWRWLARRPPEAAHALGEGSRTALLGVLVKLFFLPLMTVMFAHFFEVLVGSWRLYLDGTPSPPGRAAAAYDAGLALFLGIDVGVAFCGYLLTTRWTKNTNVSVEPTLLGWFVTVCCYPPFHTVVGTFFPLAEEASFLALPSPCMVSAIVALSLSGYAVYALATVFLGLRFSNLTHRGIVTRGPYALVRHPAYAAKCFAWWSAVAPFVVHELVRAPSFRSAFPLAGLAVQTGFYYLRAVTEERHLGADPAYAEYSAKVKYRFIPGLA